MKSVFTLLTFCISVAVAGQGLEGFDGAANFSGAESHMFRSFDNRYEGVRGFPTLLEKFIEGTVELKNGAKAKSVDINLDVVTGELLVKSRTMDKILVVQTTKVKSFAMIDAVAGRKEFVNVYGLGLCEQIYDGKLTLYLKHSKYIEKANYGGAYNSNGRRYDEFIADDKYYLVGEDSTPEEIKLSRKSIEKAFPDKADKVRDYFKEKKPDPKNLDDVVLLFAFLEAEKPANP